MTTKVIRIPQRTLTINHYDDRSIDIILDYDSCGQMLDESIEMFLSKEQKEDIIKFLLNEESYDN